jgi:hypothetical protein
MLFGFFVKTEYFFGEGGSEGGVWKQNCGRVEADAEGHQTISECA